MHRVRLPRVLPRFLGRPSTRVRCLPLPRVRGDHLRLGRIPIPVMVRPRPVSRHGSLAPMAPRARKPSNHGPVDPCFKFLPRRHPKADASRKKDRPPGRDGSNLRGHQTTTDPRTCNDSRTALSIDAIRSWTDLRATTAQTFGAIKPLPTHAPVAIQAPLCRSTRFARGPTSGPRRRPHERLLPLQQDRPASLIAHGMAKPPDNAARLFQVEGGAKIDVHRM